MNTTIKAILISIIGVAGSYMAFRLTIGKQVLQDWLIKKWQSMAKQQNKSLDLVLLTKELNALEYSQHELLVRFTLLDVVKKDKAKNLTERDKRIGAKLLEKMIADKLFEKAEFKQLSNIVFPAG